MLDPELHVRAPLLLEQLVVVAVQRDGGGRVRDGVHAQLLHDPVQEGDVVVVEGGLGVEFVRHGRDLGLRGVQLRAEGCGLDGRGRRRRRGVAVRLALRVAIAAIAVLGVGRELLVFALAHLADLVDEAGGLGAVLREDVAELLHDAPEVVDVGLLAGVRDALVQEPVCDAVGLGLLGEGALALRGAGRLPRCAGAYGHFSGGARHGDEERLAWRTV